MANKLGIRVSVNESNQTVSKFAVSESGHVVFYNDAGAELDVTFSEPLLLCKNNAPQSSVRIGAGNQEKLKVCNAADGNTFKYTATVSGAAAEDPIVIIETASLDLGYDTLLAAAVGAGIAALVTFFVTKQRPTASRG